MTVVREIHAEHGAVFETVADGRELPTHYGRPERTGRAVRNGVGVAEAAHGVIEVTGDDRVEYVDNVVTNRVPTSEGEGCYALLLDPQGGVRADLHVYNAGERLLLLTPPGLAGEIAAEWSDRIFIQDVAVAERTADFAVFGVHGPSATEKVASVLNGAAAPDARRSFVRGKIGDVGVTVVRTDDPVGEEGYEVVCASDAGADALDTLLHHGVNAVPFGLETWRALTLEAGTPLFESELAGEIPNVTGLRCALDFEKGCYVGQEVVSRVENQGRPSSRLVGLRPEAPPAADAAVFDGDSAVGEVTRAAESPALERPIAMALVDFGVDAERVTVRADGAEVPAEVAALPLVESGERSGRLPEY
jgi:aminomethyltransferase